ncbi:hypothetical protein [Eubacterium sp.]|uniref:hypothetical protein n=1 Tax=Eubacterium sp. TaxID=142586 RepID=UPI0025EA9DCD|nr:hypothetical protein [Eubacterium sp.]MCR5628397.1 hypothetical protein [Eubacterium sp.]
MSGYTYNAGDYISIRYDGIDLADEEFMFSGDNGNIYLERTISYHEGYITMELPDDAYTYDRDINESKLYDTFAVDKRDGKDVSKQNLANGNKASGTKKNNSETIVNSTLKKNQIIKDKKTNGFYKITKLVKKNGKITGGNVTYLKPVNRRCKKITIRAKFILPKKGRVRLKRLIKRRK